MLQHIFTFFASLAVLGLVSIIPWRIIRQKSENQNLKLLIYMLFLFWFARFTVAWFGGMEEDMSFVEHFFDSLIHALKSITMDDDSAAYIISGKKMLRDWNLSIFVPVYGITMSIITIVAPLISGTLLLDILLDVLPRLRLKLQRRQHKFVFSELNEKSVALAEDIHRDDNYKKVLALKNDTRKPVILFADPAMDTQSALGAELSARAKAIGALCLKEHMHQLKLSMSDSVSYFLIGSDGNRNITQLGTMLSDGAANWPKAPQAQEPVTRFYIFGQENLGGNMIKEILRKYPESGACAIVRNLRDSMNAAFNLMDEVPLFLPLMDKPREARHQLRVTVLGSSALAEECLKAAYWCGQIDGVKLHLGLAAPDAPVLAQKLRAECPELEDSCRPDAPMLKVFPKVADSLCNPPYCETLNFYPMEHGLCLTDLPQELLDETDYWIVAADSDAENLRLAGQLKLLSVRGSLKRSDGRHTVIVPAVADSQLADTVRLLAPGDHEPYVVPFASLDQLYSCKNVFMTDFTAQALTTEKLYRKKHQDSDLEDEYKYWANMARTIHAPYKIFGLGMIRRVDLTGSGEKYTTVPAAQVDQDRFAWMEHRRWNAFMRSQGFVCPTRVQLDAVYNRYGEYKSIPLKLHPCLVESQLTPVAMPKDKNFDKAAYDALDYVNFYVCHLKKGDDVAQLLAGNDYKQWDYLEYDSAAQTLLARSAEAAEVCV